MAFSPDAATVYADGPSSNPHQPSKLEIRNLLGSYETTMTNAQKPLVIVASGQSNFARISSSSTWEVPDNLKIWNNYDLTLATPSFTVTTGTAFVTPPNGRGNAAIAFAAEAARDNPTRPVYLIVVARGGTPIANWLSGGPAPDMYAAIQNSVTAALSAVGLSAIDVFLWWQGENDAAAPSNYLTNFNELVTQRLQVETWFSVTTPIVIYGIVGDAVNSNPVYAGFEQYLRACANHDPDFRMYVNTPRLPVAYWDDTLHPTGEGYRWLGRQAWQSYSKGVGQAHYYGEGTWTPTLQFGAASVGMTYANRQGVYARIGKLYVAQARITLTAKGSSTGFAVIQGLPGGNILEPVRSINCSRYLNLASLSGGIAGFAIGGQIQLYTHGAASVSVLTHANFTDTSDLWVTAIYTSTY